ncbi:MAG: hypothetical protein C4342_08125, partial [Armatimonadota bacterium]
RPVRVDRSARVRSRRQDDCRRRRGHDWRTICADGASARYARPWSGPYSAQGGGHRICSAIGSVAAGGRSSALLSAYRSNAAPDWRSRVQTVEARSVAGEHCSRRGRRL